MFKETKITKKQWETLILNGLVTPIKNAGTLEVTAERRNGFMRTTEKFTQIRCSSHYTTIVKINRTLYSVKFYSGCFQPLWFKVYDYKNHKVPVNYEVKKGIIKLVKHP